MIKYIDQWKKLTEAYISGEVNPYKECACFCGNLLNKTAGWAYDRGWKDQIHWNAAYEYIEGMSYDVIQQESEGMYTVEDIKRLEDLFLNTYDEWDASYKPGRNGIDEELLFKAFEATLDLLKTIHEEKGEDVKAQFIPPFVKRQLPV